MRCEHAVVCGITSRVSRYCARHEVRIRGQALQAPCCLVTPTVQGRMCSLQSPSTKN